MVAIWQKRRQVHTAMTRIALASAMLVAGTAVWAQNSESTAVELSEVQVLGTAEDAIKQAPGVSIITAADLQDPPVNDLADIVRKQPGVNLTGNSSSGQRGNNRQIDIRGMGPENTLILVDGKPVTSRNSIRYGWRGERDTRGDSNWVPIEAIERVEVLRGPAAARYGNGAAGGVVNIITKGVPDRFQGRASVYTEVPESSADGDTRRASLGLAGPISEQLGFRINVNAAKTDSDAWDINRDHASTRTGTFAGTFPAGREGVRNRDASARLSLVPAAGHVIDLDAAFSRQGNVYAGDTQNTNNYTTNENGELVATSQRVLDNLGKETNVMYRQTAAITHKGHYEFGSSLAFLQVEKTRNHRLDEGLAGGTEGLFSSGNFSASDLDSYTAHAQLSRRGSLAGVDHVVTVGAEWVRQQLNDRNSVTQTTTEGGSLPGLADTGRGSKYSATIASLFVEDNIALTDNTLLTPGVRVDHHSEIGVNWSPSLNVSHFLSEQWSIKAGVARSYKAPNLYQSNPNYLLYSRGIGCWGGGGACYLQGNPELKAETSINKELGVEYAGASLLTGLTYFHNDYRNKIEAGRMIADNATGGIGEFANADVFRWTNVPKAVISGLEGTLNWKIAPAWEWNNNFTYMIDSKNKSTQEQLSIIPKYTVNSRLNWSVNPDWTLHTSVTWFGKQKPNQFDFQGLLLQGEEARARSAYALVSLGGYYAVSKNVHLSLGVNNLFDKRLYREGNAVGVNNPRTIYGAGANTYNEPGRSYYVSVSADF